MHTCDRVYRSGGFIGHAVVQSFVNSQLSPTYTLYACSSTSYGRSRSFRGVQRHLFRCSLDPSQTPLSLPATLSCTSPLGRTHVFTESVGKATCSDTTTRRMCCCSFTVDPICNYSHAARLSSAVRCDGSARWWVALLPGP